ncbi:activating signal cointegrator 1 complex subunit 3 isoform X1 [Tachysurus ichikawai]
MKHSHYAVGRSLGIKIQADKQVQRSRNKQMKEMFPEGFGIHHAGMLRQDRTLMENMFSRGYLKVLVCTATLAWGVNLPAHAVIIKVKKYH